MMEMAKILALTALPSYAPEKGEAALSRLSQYLSNHHERGVGYRHCPLSRLFLVWLN
jgi:hypothetical protein